MTQWKVVWGCLLALRFALLLQPGYVHPDEFFQSPEVMAHSVFDFEAHIPWEFKSGCRSVVPPFFASGVPFMLLNVTTRLLSWLSPDGILVNPYLLLLSPRLLLFGLSVLADMLIASIAVAVRVPSHIVLCLVASSWPAIVMHVRAFSNTLESFLLILAIWVAFSAWTSSFWLRNLVFGAVVAAGFFTRFTFIIFVWPLGIYLLFNAWSRMGKSAFLPVLFAWVRVVLIMLTGFIPMSLALIVADSYYYGHPTFTPYNSLRYNMQEENLREHGIHPRYLHALVNMPIMFGPIALLSAFHFIRLSIARAVGGSKHQHVAPPTRRRSTKNKRKRICGLPLALGTMRLTLGACVIAPLVILSCAPHQEPRFLLPLLPVLALLISGDLAILHSRYFFLAWILWNIAGVVFFGILQQGGLIPALQYLRYHCTSSSERGDIIFFHTYMPPRHLLALPAGQDQWLVHDLAGQPLEHLYTTLDAVANRAILVVAPQSVGLGERSERFTRLQSFWPHVSTEDLPQSFAEASLSLYAYH